MPDTTPITPATDTSDRLLRVYVSSTPDELAAERAAARDAITTLRLVPVLFELGARPHPPQEVYRTFLAQSQAFVGIYWQGYGRVPEDGDVSDLEDELIHAATLPRLVYQKTPAPDMSPRLRRMLDGIERDESILHRFFSDAAELKELLQNDLAVLIGERFKPHPRDQTPVTGATTPLPVRQVAPLPIPPTRLVGRAREVETLERLVCSGERPLVTLTGPGGSGKTRLAIEVAGRLTECFSDGVAFVPLAPVVDPRLVGPTIAAALDVRESPGAQLMRSLEGHLRSRHLLLVLDNFEHVIEAAPVVAGLLQASDRLRVVVTSRTPLRIRGEAEFPVPPLETPGPGDHLDHRAADRFAAVELFVERARATLPSFSMTEDLAPTIAELSRRLDGLPLALELAAARVRLIPPRDLLRRLERGLDVLDGGLRDLPTRQQTLRAAIDWSYALLDDPARVLFRRLSVFAGGWTLDAAESICGPGDPPLDVLSAMESLLDASLVVRRDDPAGGPRYFMLQTIREFAAERLADVPREQSDLRRRHAGHYLSQVELAEPGLRSADRARWIGRLAREYGNLQAALAWSTGADGDTETALRFSWALAWYWQMRGQITEGRGWVDRAVGRDPVPAGTCERARGLSVAGGLAWLQGDLAAAAPALDEAVALGRDTCDGVAVAYALTYHGLVVIASGDPEGAGTLFHEAALLFRAHGDRWGEALALNWLGNADHSTGLLDEARHRYEESLSLWRETGDRRATAMPLAGMGWLLMGADDLAHARERFEQAVEVADEAGDQYLRSWSLSGLGFAELRSGDTVRAEEHFRESLLRGVEVGNPAALLMSLAGMAAATAICEPCEVGAGGPEQSSRARDTAVRIARILGAAEALRGDLRMTLWHFSRELYERVLSTARERVGPTLWERETTVGAALDLQAAVEYAAEGSGTGRVPS